MDVATLSGGISGTQGAAYVFVRTGTAWSLQARLTADDGLPISYFGYSVAINGDTVVVGSARNAAYVYVRSGIGWSQQQRLVRSDPGPQRFIGHVVAISGETIIVNASECVRRRLRCRAPAVARSLSLCAIVGLGPNKRSYSRRPHFWR